MHIARPTVRTAAFTRPADTAQYTANDAVSDNTTTATAATFTLSSMAAYDGGGGVLHSLSIHKTDQDLVGADFDVYLFSTQPVGTTYEDNAAIAITDAVFQTCVGVVEFTAAEHAKSPVTGDYFYRTDLDVVYQCASSSTSLYFVVVARGSYTPASAEVFTLKFGFVVE